MVKRRKRLMKRQSRQRTAYYQDKKNMVEFKGNPEMKFEEISFSITAELIQKGHLHPDGTPVTFSNVHEARIPIGTLQ